MSNVHGPLADLAILHAEEVVWVVLWLFFLVRYYVLAQPFVRASRPNAAVMSFVCSLYLIIASFN